MFSSDKNVETIGQLIETSKHYIGLQAKYAKLDVMTKLVRLLTVAIMVFFLAVLLMLALIYLSFSAAYALGSVVGNACGFLVVAAAYIIVLLLCVCFRKKWIERPLVRFLADILLQD